MKMKQEKITTSKGEFLVVDGEFDILMPKYGQSTTLNLCDKSIQVFNPIKLSEITEEQASEVVSSLVKDDNGNKSYVHTLHSLLKSQGIHLFENPIDLNEQLDCNCDMCYQKLEDAFDEAEEKTFYNPYIFRV